MLDEVSGASAAGARCASEVWDDRCWELGFMRVGFVLLFLVPYSQCNVRSFEVYFRPSMGMLTRTLELIISMLSIMWLEEFIAILLRALSR